MDEKAIFGTIAIVIAFFSYLPYFNDIFTGKTKPHAFSWLVWSLISAIIYFSQISSGGGAGAWVNAFTAIICFIIFIFGLVKGRSNIIFIDWLCLLGSGIAIMLWIITKGPLLSVILVTIIDAFGFFPTFRKSFVHPHQETVITFFLSGIKYVFAIFALQSFSLVTALFPIYLVVANWLFVGMVLVRKKKLRKQLLLVNRDS